MGQAVVQRLRIYSPHGCRVLFLQGFKNVGSRKMQHHFILIFGSGRTETGMKKFFHQIATLKCPVMLLQLTFFLCRKPITTAGQKFLLQLGIDLFMFDMGTIYLVFYLNAKKTPTAGRVGQANRSDCLYQ